MTDMRHQKVRNVADSIPTPEVHGAESGDVLVLGWGSTVGILRQAVENAQAKGQSVSRIHLTHVWPLPHGLDEIFARFKVVLIPEMNVAQMTSLLRGELPDHNYIPFNKVTGQPFLVTEIEAEIKRVLDEHAGA